MFKGIRGPPRRSPKSGQWWSPEKRPTDLLIRDIVLMRGLPSVNNEQCLERGKETASWSSRWGRLGWSLRRIEATVHIQNRNPRGLAALLPGFAAHALVECHPSAIAPSDKLPKRDNQYIRVAKYLRMFFGGPTFSGIPDGLGRWDNRAGSGYI
jgi:hypothetical protein